MMVCPENAAQARFFGRLGDRVLEVVHVGVRGGAGQRHFEARQAGTPADKLGVDVAGFGGEDVVLEPVLQAFVVGDAAEQRHGGVGVGVDEAGGEDGAAGVEALFRLVVAVDLAAFPDSRDATVAYGHGAVGDDAMGGVHGDHVARGPDGVDGLGCEQGQGEQQRGNGAGAAPGATGSGVTPPRGLISTKHQKASETVLSGEGFGCRR